MTTFEEFRAEIKEYGNRLGSELPETKTVLESLRQSYDMGLYPENAYWRAIDTL